ncbi:MAG: response regulator transcription factor [Calditrichaeota bacterium]|nr:response regulator transcription factor [Calditrichota bacterium]
MMRSIIIDDEIWAREKIKLFIEDISGMTVIGEAASGDEAIKLIINLKPDLIFLDIQMPRMNGFEMLEQLKTDAMPMIIFTTAYQQHAIQAFETHAVDYLLKPYDRDRFVKSVQHVQSLRHQSGQTRIEEKLKLLINSALNEQQINKLSIKHNGSIYLLPPDEIRWIEAFGNYVRIKTDSEYLHRETVHSLMEKLDQSQFIRIHRSAIVNSNHIVKLAPTGSNEFEITLTDGKKINSSRSYRRNLDRLIS